MANGPLRRVRFEALPGWQADDHLAAFHAFRRSAARNLEKPYRTGTLGGDDAAFARCCRAALELDAGSIPVARTFFETRFAPYFVEPTSRARGFVTGFYEPVVAASPERTARFAVPLLARPGDLIDVDEADRPAGLDPSFRFARRMADGRVVEYFDRADIERGAIDPDDLALAWLADPVDAFFIHVQGAARLRMPDGSTRRVTYSAKSGHPFTGPGGVLVELGEIPYERVTMQSIRAWFRENPGRVEEILHRNRSYIFFREAEVEDESMGPVAAAKVPLAAGRSMAVDRLIHRFGSPFFIDAPELRAFGGEPFRRLMIAQDTGSAIVGPARGDLFAGSGDAAGEIAGVVRADADFYLLLPVDG